MKIAVMQFPGTNCEYECLVSVKEVGMDGELFRWNRPAGELSAFDGFIVPGGWSYADRIRAGAIASKEPVMDALREEAAKGKPIIGICNGFQILVESGLLPGNAGSGKIEMALAQNTMIKDKKIVRRGYYVDWVNLRTEASPKRCSGSFNINKGELLQIPIAHGEGNLVTMDKNLVKKLNDEGQVVFRYCDSNGRIIPEFPVNVNGSTENIAGICNPEGNVLGMMPHPERAFFAWQLPPHDPRKHQKGAVGPGRKIFESMKAYIEVRA
ncbi:MAG: phosphoribosylformylglycinamidine synthase I [Methanotrichaceae archaeon]